MSVILLAIKFNHDPATAATNALTIRRNATHFIEVPEWRLGVSVLPWDSMAAYAIRETRGRTVTIKANFLRTDPMLRSMEVRALQQTPPAGALSMALLHWMLSPLLSYPAYYQAYYAHYLSKFALATGGHVLGNLKARQVVFRDQGDTEFETFELQDPWPDSRGVGVSDMSWRWQFRRSPFEPWIDFALTSHRIYAVLQVPTAPWQQFPDASWNTDLPWSDVLEYACRWARGTRSADEAATRLTQSVYSLGGLVSYDCFAPDFGIGMPHYSMGMPELGQSWFACTKFLERLRGGLGNGLHVNCSDCATIVSTFANALGCDLSQSTMVAKAGGAFQLNPTRSIGSHSWLSACGVGLFAMHEVAWKGDGSEDDEVFDACLQVDGDADPTKPPHTPLLPTNLRFGKSGDGHYLDRLVPPLGRPNCRPTRSPQRRQVL